MFDPKKPSTSSSSSSTSSLFSLKMLARAKDTTKSLVHEVMEKRHSLDSKRSINEPPITIPSNDTPSDNEYNSDSHDRAVRTLSSRRKHYSLPIKRPFVIKKDTTKSMESSLSSASLVTNTTATASSLAPASTESITAAHAAVANGGALENDAMANGTERPGSLAAACDFRLASDKRNDEFHALFKSVHENDMLIQDYKCALHKEILLQGHMYVSEHHVCFKSNIFGWVTNLVINFSEIIRVEKRMTAKIIPNGILIATNTSTHIFASFLSRDQAFDQIVKLWDIQKQTVLTDDPNSFDEEDEVTDYDDDDDDDDEDDDGSIPSVDSGVILNSPPLLITDHDSILHQEGILQEKAKHPPTDNITVDVITPVADSNAKPDNATPSADNNNSNNNNTAANTTTATTANNTNSNAATLTAAHLTDVKQRPRSVSDSYANSKDRRNLSIEPKQETGSKRETRQAQEPLTPIKKTRVCPCTVKGEQYFHVALNETYPGTVDAMFKLLYDSSFTKGFLEKYENFEDVQLGGWKHGAREITGKRKIKSSTMGTKIVKTLFQEKRIHRKLPYYCCVTARKSMPDMPMGAVYSIQSRTCITRVNKEKVHVLVTFQVVFSKSGLVSSIIEKNAADDQLRLYSHLNSILNKPDLIREIVTDQDILMALKMVKIEPKAERHNTSPKPERGARLTHFVYLGLFVVLLMHCLLALRLHRLTHRLKHVQQTVIPQKQTDAEWVVNKLDTLHQRMHLLKDEVQTYNQRISQLRDMQ